jgi:four helix bundle protein
MKIKKYEDLAVWKLSIEVVLDVYSLTNKPVFSKDFGLRDQVRRASVSISSNIVEGFERSNNNEFIRFLKIAKGSAGEVKNQLYIASRLSYISLEEYETIASKLQLLSNQVGKFIVYLTEKKQEKEFKFVNS